MMQRFENLLYAVHTALLILTVLFGSFKLTQYLINGPIEAGPGYFIGLFVNIVIVLAAILVNVLAFGISEKMIQVIKVGDFL